MWQSIKLLLGGIAVFAGIYLMLHGSIPGLVDDIQYQGEFVPAVNAKVTSARCENWNVAMFNRCTITVAASRPATNLELEYWRFGRAGDERFQLLERRGQPRIFTTDVALASMYNRLAFTATWVLAAMLFVYALGIGSVRRGRQS